jgi:Fe2+ transport system protein FeoA
MQVSVNSIRTLRDLRPGESAFLGSVDLPDDFAQWMMQLGFVPGVEVAVGASAPGGDPRIYQVDGTEIALRNETAAALKLR